jgi:hypothetical protein
MFSPELVGRQETLVIRPHHLSHYYGFMHNYLRLGNTAVARLRARYTQVVEAHIWHPDTTDPAQRTYLSDVLGNTIDTARAHVDGLMRINQDFIAGSDDMAVKIAPEKDRLCLETCAIGQHCEVMETEIEEDYMGQFLVMASAAGIEVESDHGNAIHTHLGSLKYILSHHIQNNNQ